MLLHVLIVDDHALFREATGLLLESNFPDATVVEAATAEEALRLVSHYTNLDLVVLDLSMPGLGGVDAVRQLCARGVSVPVLVVTASEDADTVHAVIEAGAAGFVPKKANSRELLNAIRVVQAGQLYVPAQYLSGALATRVEQARAGPAEPIPCDITPRQREVLQLLARGYLNKQIAGALNISEATVKLHVSAIIRELGATNRTDAVMRATRAGLIENT